MEIHRFYIRAGVKGFSVEIQREMQAEAGLGHVPTYEDVRRIPEKKLRDAKSLEQRQALLTERTMLLRPTSREGAETIAVAGIRCLAMSLRDLVTVMAACKQRHAAIYCLNTAKLYDPVTMTLIEVDEMQAEYESAARAHQTDEGRKVGPQARSKQAEKDRAPIIKLVKPFWGMPLDDPRHMSTAQIRDWLLREHKIKVSVSALNMWLGPRWKAREEGVQR